MRCSGCGVHRAARPTELGCCAPTVAYPQQIIDCKLLNRFCSGLVGAEQFVTETEARWSLQWGWRGGGPPLKPRALSAAAQEWQRLQPAPRPAGLGLEEARKAQGRVPDCAACSLVLTVGDIEEYRRKHMNDEPVPAFVPVWDVRKIQTFTADGNLKGGRFGQRRPQLRRHYSHRALLLRQRQQPVLARAARRQPPFCPRAGVPAYPGQPGLPPPTSDVRARVPQGRRRRDRHMGGVHGFPVEGAFIAMDGPENFSLGCEMLGDVLGDTEVHHYYQDTACSFSGHFDK